MSSRPTLTAVAAAAGVSTATVDRVLNSRLPVREATALRVIEAAEVVDELPRTAMQKIDRRALAERFGPDDGRPGGEAGSR